MCHIRMFINVTSHFHFTSWTVIYWVHKMYVSFCDIILCFKLIKIIPNHTFAYKQCDIMFTANFERGGILDIKWYYFLNSSFLAYSKPRIRPQSIYLPFVHSMYVSHLLTLFYVTGPFWKIDQLKKSMSIKVGFDVLEAKVWSGMKQDSIKTVIRQNSHQVMCDMLKVSVWGIAIELYSFAIHSSKTVQSVLKYINLNRLKQQCR